MFDVSKCLEVAVALTEPHREKTFFRHMRTTKVQIRLRIRAV